MAHFIKSARSGVLWVNRGLLMVLLATFISTVIFASDTPDFWAQHNKDGNQRNASDKPVNGNLRVRWVKNFDAMRVFDGFNGSADSFAQRSENFSIRNGLIYLVMPPSESGGMDKLPGRAVFGMYSISDGRLVRAVMSPNEGPYNNSGSSDNDLGSIPQSWGSDGLIYTQTGGDALVGPQMACQFDPWTGEIPFGRPIEWTFVPINASGAFNMTDSNPRLIAKGYGSSGSTDGLIVSVAEDVEYEIRPEGFWAATLLEGNKAYAFNHNEVTYGTQIIRYDFQENPLSFNKNGVWTYLDTEVTYKNRVAGSVANSFPAICLGEDGRLYYFGHKVTGTGSTATPDYSQGMFLKGVRTSDGVVDKIIQVSAVDAGDLSIDFKFPQLAARGNSIVVFQSNKLFCFDTTANILRWHHDFTTGYFPAHAPYKLIEKPVVQMVISGNEAFLVFPFIQGGVLNLQVERFSLVDGAHTTSTFTPLENGQTIPVASGAYAGYMDIIELAAVDGSLVCLIDHGMTRETSSSAFKGPLHQTLVVLDGDASLPKDYPPMAAITAPVTGGTLEPSFSDFPVRPTNEFFGGRSISFSSAGSVDPDGGFLAYNWTFGDGTTSTEANPVHTYAVEGLPMAAKNYTVTLQVQDNEGNWSAPASRVLSIRNAGVLQNTVRQAIADTYVDFTAANVNVNYGNKITMRAGNVSGALRRAYVKFDTTGVDLANLASAKLRLYFLRPPNSSSTLDHILRILQTSDGWGETTIKASNAPAVGAGIVEQSLKSKSSLPGSFPEDAYGVWLEIPVTDYIRSAGTDGLVSLAMELEGLIQTNFSINTREDGHAPELVLETGIPSAAAPIFTQQPPSSIAYTGATGLSALASSVVGENMLTYHWRIVSAPVGGIATFSANHTNAAKVTALTISGTLGTYTFECVASDGLQATASSLMTVREQNAAPTVAQAATGVLSADGLTATLSVLGADDGGEANLTYTWAVTSLGGTASFSVNGTNSAKTTVATFDRVDIYDLTVTITDAGGKSVSSPVTVNVPSIVGRIEINLVLNGPAITEVIIAREMTQSFSFHMFDQFGRDSGAIGGGGGTWSVSGGGTFSAVTKNLFMAASTPGGPYALTGTYKNVSTTIPLTVIDGPGNTPPTISDIADQVTTVNTVKKVIFTVGDAESPSSLTMSISSSNTVILPNNFAGAGPGIDIANFANYKELSLKPAVDQTGSTTVTVSVTDAGGKTATKTFVLTVIAGTNKVPTITNILDQTTNEDTAKNGVAFTVGDVETAVGNLIVSAISSDTTLLPNANITLGGSGATRTISMVPVMGKYGKSLVTVTVTDEAGLSASDTFLLKVNHAPVITTPAYADGVTPSRFTVHVVAMDVEGSPLTYSWSQLSGPGTGTFATPNSANSDVSYSVQGTYVLRVSVSDGLATTTGDVTVTLEKPLITSQPVDQTVSEGQTTTFSVSATSVAAMTYTWKKNGVNIVGGTNATYTTPATVLADSGAKFTVVVKNIFGNTTSAAATLTVSPSSGNTAPTIANIADQTVNEDTPTNAIGFTVGDVETAVGSLTLSVASSNTALVPVANVVFGGAGANRAVTVTPATNQSGTATITVTVSDGSLTASDSFVLTVNAVNDLPTISNIADQSTNEDVPLNNVAFTVGDIETAAGSLNVTAASSNTTLLPNANIVLGGTGANRIISMNPVVNQNGTATVTVTVKDAGNSTAVDTFVLTVNAVNDAPTISDIVNQSINQDTATSALAFTVGDVETAAGSLTVTGASNNTTLVPVSGIVFGGAGANRTVTVAPAAGQTGSATVTVTVSDGSLTASDSFVLTVGGVNHAPVANAQSVTTNEDTVKTITLDGSDSDGNSLTYSVVSQPVHGSLSGTAPALTYTPAANYNGPDSFTFKANDGIVDSPTATISITVTAVNDVPVANAQSVTTNEDVAKAITLSGSDVESFSLTYSVVTQPAHGLLTGTAPNLTYTPDANYNGLDSFTFKVNDGTVDSPAATVSITVNAVNDVPVANTQSVTTNEDVSKTVTLSGSDVDGNSLTYIVVANPVHGNLGGTAPALTYTPAADYNGSDSFTFKVNDGTVDSATVTVSITVIAVNDAPTIGAIADKTTSQDTSTPALSFTVGDVETVAGSLTVSGASNNTTLVPVSGIVFGGSGANRTVTITPAAGKTGTATITVSVSDGSLTANSSFILTVTGVNHAPVANAQSVTTNEDTATSVTLAGSDSDGDSLTYSLVAQPTHGTLTGTAPSLTYTPAANYNGPDSFTFKANDGILDSSPATVSITITAVNDVPVANAQSVTANEDTAKTITLTGSDVESFSLTYSVVTQPVHGLLTGTAPNLTYTPDVNYNGLDSFTFKVNDGAVDSSVATVSITVAEVNDAPVAAAQSVTTNEDVAKAITLTGSDVDGNSLTYAVVAQPAHGSLSGTAPNLTYTPAANYNGPDSFTFKVNDGIIDSSTAIVSMTVNAVNDAPVANAQSITTPQDTATTVMLTGTDIENSALTYSIVAQPTHGALSGTVPNLTYTPTANYKGADSFTFKVNDGSLDSSTVTVSITVTGVNHAPVANAQSVSTDEDAAKAITLIGSDVDGDSLAYAVVAQPGHGTLSGTAPNLTYTPTANFNGPDSFAFKVNDGILDSTTVTVSITINAVNDAPVASAQSVTVDEDAFKTITLSGSDVENSSLSYTLLSQPVHGVLSGSIPTLTYTPDANYSGADSFTFKVNDGAVDSSVATVSITVAEVNDAPTISTIANQVTNEDVPLNGVAFTVGDLETTAANLSLTATSSDTSVLPVSGITFGGTGANRVVHMAPALNKNGTTTVEVQVTDGGGLFATSMFQLTVAPVNDAPVADAQTIAVIKDTDKTIKLTASDADGDSLTYDVVDGPAHGTLFGSAPLFIYMPDAGYTGSDSFTFKAGDGILDSSKATVSISVDVAAPVAATPSITTQPTTQIVSGGGGGGGSVTVINSPSSGIGSSLASSSNTGRFNSGGGFNGGANFNGVRGGFGGAGFNPDNFQVPPRFPSVKSKETPPARPDLPVPGYISPSYMSSGSVMTPVIPSQPARPVVNNVKDEDFMTAQFNPVETSNSPSQTQISPVVPKQGGGNGYGAVGGLLAAAMGLSVLLSESVRNTLGVSDSFSIGSISQQTSDLARRLFS